LAVFDQIGLEVGVARLEEPLALPVGPKDGIRAEGNAGELALVEGGKGDGVEVEGAHGTEKDTRRAESSSRRSGQWPKLWHRLLGGSWRGGVREWQITSGAAGHPGGASC